LHDPGHAGAGSPCQGSSMSDPTGTDEQAAAPDLDAGARGAERDLAEVPAAEVVATVAVHLMSAAAVKTGLGEEGDAALDLDEARKLITALAGLLSAARPDLGVHANPLLDGLQSLQRAFREASPSPDAPGEGPGERLTAALGR
jgi:hypothetical protein